MVKWCQKVVTKSESTLACKLLWHSPEEDFTGNTQIFTLYMSLKITHSRAQPYLQRINELIVKGYFSSMTFPTRAKKTRVKMWLGLRYADYFTSSIMIDCRSRAHFTNDLWTHKANVLKYLWNKNNHTFAPEFCTSKDRSAVHLPHIDLHCLVYSMTKLH